jgi:hypothetical protein
VSPLTKWALTVEAMVPIQGLGLQLGGKKVAAREEEVHLSIHYPYQAKLNLTHASR